jgi:hypothetical protein
VECYLEAVERFDGRFTELCKELPDDGEKISLHIMFVDLDGEKIAQLRSQMLKCEQQGILALY